MCLVYLFAHTIYLIAEILIVGLMDFMGFSRHQVVLPADVLALVDVSALSGLAHDV